MHRARHQARICLGRTPPDKWSGRVCQPSLAQGPKEKTRESQGNLGGVIIFYQERYVIYNPDVFRMADEVPRIV